MTNPSQLPSDLSPEERRALLAELLRQKARAIKTTQPLTYGQQALWFNYQLAPESPAYNVAFASFIHSPVNVAAMRRAFETLVTRHSALRTTFPLEGERPVQSISAAADFTFERVDAAGWSDAELHSAVDLAYRQPFDLARGPLHRLFLFTRSEGEHVLLFTVHHVVVDGWSIGILTDELYTLYRADVAGRPANLPPVENQFSDYAAWHNTMLAGPQGQKLRTYWHESLAGELPVLDIPTDFPRPTVQSFRGATLEAAIEGDLLQGLRALARSEHTTLYTVMLSAFYVLLHRYTSQEDLIVGTPMAGRSHTEFQKTVGYMVSPVPMRAHITGDLPFKALLAQVRHVVLGALDAQDYPFALLVEELQPRREAGRTPIMEVMFNLIATQHFGQMAEALSGGGQTQATEVGSLRMENYPLSQEDGQFDLNLMVVESADRMLMGFKYSTDLFADATIQRMAAHLRKLLEGVVAHPDQHVGSIPILSASEREQILVQWNATAMDYPADRCVHELVAEQAARTPHAIALRCEGAQISYAELDQRANQLAHHLRGLGVAPGTLVAILTNRSIEMVVGLLGVLKAGGAYVPLDPAFPAERLAMMLEDSRAPIVLSEEGLKESAAVTGAHVICLDTEWETIGRQPGHAPSPLAGPNDLAYVIFTSGSTGRPKGVKIPQRAVVNFLHSMRHAPGLHAGDVLVAVTTLSFDIAVLELFLPLVVGAQAVIATRESATNGDLLAELLTHTGATVMQATPVTWRMLLAAEWTCPAGFKALCGGEALPPQLAHDLLERGVELWNMYGPTETTVWSAVEEITNADAPIVVGRPIGNTQLYVLNAQLLPVPVGVAGELCIGGDGVACGYLDRPELTLERFVADPFRADPAARLYRTGDLARLMPDGRVQVLGRTDHQVKIRGFRIELGEIETALARHPQVHEAVVTAREDGRGLLRLIAYVVAAGAQPPQAGELRVHLRASLPDYMIPALFIPLEEMPRTPNGKINRRALPSPEPARARADEQVAAPSTPTEQVVAAVWRQVLGTSRVGVYDNFFDLGGHSLIAMEALEACRKQLGPRLNPALFRTQTLGQIAASYDELLREPSPKPAHAAAAGDSAAKASNGQSAAAPGEPSGLAGRLLGAVRRAIKPGDRQN